MKSKIVAVILFLAVFSACKNEEQKAADEPKIPVKEYFSVEVNVIAQTLDNFALYYTENNTSDFVQTQAVWKGVNGGGKQETVTLDLPQDVVPTNIRLDLGIDPNRKDVIVQSVKLSFYDKVFEIKGSDFMKFFLPNPGLIANADAAQGTITFTKKPESKEDSYFYPSQELIDQIAKMTK